MIKTQQETEKPLRLHWGGFATSLFGVFIAGIFLIVQGVVLGILTVIEIVPDSGADIEKAIQGLFNSGFTISIVLITEALICIPLIFLIIRIRQGLSIREYLQINFVAPKKLLPWFAAVIVFLIAYDIFTRVIGRPIVPEFMTTAYITARYQPLLWIAFIVFAPLSEEFFFRGFLFKGFQFTFLRPVGTVLLTSFLWAIIHTQYDYYDISFVFIIGILLGTARQKSKSILTPLYLHSFMNLVATIETAIVVS